jgi:hypothetical protein
MMEGAAFFSSLRELLAVFSSPRGMLSSHTVDAVSPPWKKLLSPQH